MTIQLISIYISLLFSTTIYVTGHLRNHSSSKKYFTTSGRQILVKADNKIIAQSRTDKRGDFKINFSDDANIKSYNFYVINSSDTLFLNSFSTFDNETPEITLFIK